MAKEERIGLRISKRLKDAMRKHLEKSEEGDISRFIREAIIEKIEREMKENKKKEDIYSET